MIIPIALLFLFAAMFAGIAIMSGLTGTTEIRTEPRPPS